MFADSTGVWWIRVANLHRNWVVIVTQAFRRIGVTPPLGVMLYGVPGAVLSSHRVRRYPCSLHLLVTVCLQALARRCSPRQSPQTVAPTS